MTMVDLIAFAGAPGSGKTTIADRLHARLRSVFIDFGARREDPTDVAGA